MASRPADDVSANSEARLSTVKARGCILGFPGGSVGPVGAGGDYQMDVMTNGQTADSPRPRTKLYSQLGLEAMSEAENALCMAGMSTQMAPWLGKSAMCMPMAAESSSYSTPPPDGPQGQIERLSFLEASSSNWAGSFARPEMRSDMPFPYPGPAAVPDPFRASSGEGVDDMALAAYPEAVFDRGRVMGTDGQHLDAAMAGYLNLYWEKVHPICPVLDATTLEAAVDEPPEHTELLRYSMAALAADFLAHPEHRRRGGQFYAHAWQGLKTVSDGMADALGESGAEADC